MNKSGKKKLTTFISVFILFSLVLFFNSCTQTSQNSAPEVNNPEQTKKDKNNHNHNHNHNHKKHGSHPVSYGSESVILPELPLQPLGEIKDKKVKIKITKPKKNSASSVLQTLATGDSPLEMKVLIITATETDYVLDALKALFKQVGVPYDVLVAATEDLTLAKLTSNGVGHYQGIFLTTNSLSYDSGGGNWVSAFDWQEWNILWQYERDFKVREVAMYSYPSAWPDDFGLRFKQAVSTNNTPLDIKLTSKGQEVFASLQPSADIPIKHAYTYLATLDTSSGIVAEPLLEDAAGNIAAVVGTSVDGRERIHLTMGHNPYLLHTQLLGYELLRWVTQGVFIGERRLHLNIDEDDLYLESDVWNPATLSNWDYDDYHFRLSGKDLLATRNQVIDLRNTYPLAKDLQYVHVFNAHKGDLNATVDCSATASLSSAVLCTNNFFDWVNHTWSHAEMDFKTYAESTTEFKANIDFANLVNLNFNPNSVVTGRHSGLGWFRIADVPAGATCQYDQIPTDEYCQFGLQYSNQDMLKAAKDLGIKYLAANRGWLSHTADCDSCGIVHPLEPSILLIPRWPTNIFYNVTNPTEEVSEFNYFYGPNGIIKDANGNPFFIHDLSYAEILEFEADISLYHVLTFSPYPHFFHQNNLREYSTGKSLLYDWNKALISKYSSYLNLPLVSQKWSTMADYVNNRTSFFEAGVTGIWNRSSNTVSISATNGGTVFITGAKFNNANEKWVYGKDKVAVINLAANQTNSGEVVAGTNNQVPVINSITDQLSIEGDTVSLNVTASDADGDTLTYLAAGLPTGLTINTATGTISGTLPTNSAQEYTVVVSVTDSLDVASNTFYWVVSPLIKGGYEVINVNSKKCLSTGSVYNTDGANAIQAKCTNGTNKNQLWYFERVKNYYRLRSANNNHALDVADDSLVDGATVIRWPWNGGENQLWEVRKTVNGYVLRASHSNKCLTVEKSSLINGANVEQWQCDNISSQHWLLKLPYTATSSSIGWGGYPHKAVDGNTNGNHRNGSVSHTYYDTNPWLTVDTKVVKVIGSLVIWNRTDCCANRLSNGYVFVSSEPFTSTDPVTTAAQSNVWSYRFAGALGRSTTIPVNKDGRYVRVQLIGSNRILSLAEVQVF